MGAVGEELYHDLRKKYPYFIYKEFNYRLVNKQLEISFDFDMGGQFSFSPRIFLSLPAAFNPDILASSLFRNLVFNMGMVELLSYWKAACPPLLIVEASSLDPWQLDWWKKLYLNGLGEFFHTNGIFPSADFISIKPVSDALARPDAFAAGEGILVPVGGGKDSVVTLELLPRLKPCRPFIVNPRPASLRTAHEAGFGKDDMVVMRREIHPQLLELNEMGFLNGHTPFSAMLAFASAMAAMLYKMGEVALSNESSANEPTVADTSINHQYSKTLEFENDFREYMERCISPGIRYYSFLRPLNELQIAKLFAEFPQHHMLFRSCNVGSRHDRWCGKCPKCLFTFIILFPFLGHRKLVEIFGRDLFDDVSLAGLLDQLIGRFGEKPFECVGRTDEVNAALVYAAGSFGDDEMPGLIRYYLGKMPFAGENMVSFPALLHEFSENNLPGEPYINLLKKALHG
jgi:UDP-N-acetyl-alpha-D-muramoyl-L-alanyl-L-glutamate epimerase